MLRAFQKQIEAIEAEIDALIASCAEIEGSLYECYVHAFVPRMDDDSGVNLAEVPWARPQSGFTLLMEALVVMLARTGMSVAEAARVIGEYPQRLWLILEKQVAKARAAQRLEGVTSLSVDEVSRAKGHEYLTIRFGVSRKTGYKWLKRYAQSAVLSDQSRRPHSMPRQTEPSVEQGVLELRALHPAWGGRKLRRRLLDLGRAAPAASTITEILRRHSLLTVESTPQGPWQRFARTTPNDLWQMDFKGHVPCRGGRCHPLTALDDCSRFAVVLKACEDEQRGAVQNALIEAFRRYGLPWEMLMDNGSPWGGEFFTRLSIWLMRLGILITHGRPGHPQTQGKEERFHRTLRAELIGQALPWDLLQCQQRFDQWRHIYNTQRPHEALEMMTPAARYQISARAYPETLPEIAYAPEDKVRRVQAEGWLTLQGRHIRISKALRGQPVAFRADPQRDGLYAVYFCRQKITDIDLNHMPKGRTESVTHVPEHL